MNSAELIQTDDLLIDLRRRRVTRAGEVLDIAGLTFDLLAALIAAAPEALSADALSQTVWQQTHVSEETLSQRVALLRKALGDTARDPRYVRTVRHRGYAWLALVSDQSIEAPRALTLPPAAWTAIAAGAASLVILLAWTAWPRPSAQAPSEIARSAAPEDLDLSIRLDRAQALIEVHQSAATDQAITLLEQLVADYPDLIRPRISLSFALTTRVTKFTAQPDDLTRARALAQAITLSHPDEGAGWSALGYALDSQGRLNEALNAYRQAITLDPTDIAAQSSAAYLLLIRGEFHEALRLEAAALELAPPTLYAPTQIATTLSLIGHPAADIWWSRALADGSGTSVALAERLREHLRRDEPDTALTLLEAQPESVQTLPRLQRLRGLLLIETGDETGARAALERGPGQALLESTALDLMLGQERDIAFVDTLLSEARRNGETWPDMYVLAAAVKAQAGEMAEAESLLASGIDLGWRDLRWLENSRLYAPLLAGEAWPELRARIERERDAQRRLIETDPALAELLERPG
ncbi:MAG: tetratricopeptide repeat protein [Alphaproteobacteria bacterium]|nr:tetratricopeptide repeat protein [Alphaproteobacteria bacterium]